MSAVQSLAALLSANADANSRVQSAAMASNASLGNSANALRGDVYRANIQGQIANRGIDADMQRHVAEQALRSMIGQGQLRMQGQQNNLAGQQLGLQRQQMMTERDLKLGDLGQGPYAPKIPGAPEGETDTPEAMIRRMFMANPNNPKFAGMMGELLGQGQRQNQWQQEFDFKKGALSDPNALFAQIAPHVAGMEGVTPDGLPGILANLRAQLGGQQAAAGGAAPGAPTFSSLAAASSEIGRPDNVELLRTLGLGDRPNAYDAGMAVEGRLPNLTGTDLTSLQKVFSALSQADPQFFDKVPGAAQVQMIKAMLGSSPQTLTPELLRERLGAARKSNANNSAGFGDNYGGGFGSY